MHTEGFHHGMHEWKQQKRLVTTSGQFYAYHIVMLGSQQQRLAQIFLTFPPSTPFSFFSPSGGFSELIPTTNVLLWGWCSILQRKRWLPLLLLLRYWVLIVNISQWVTHFSYNIKIKCWHCQSGKLEIFHHAFFWDTLGKGSLGTTTPIGNIEA